MRVSQYDSLVKKGEWVRAPDFCLPVIPQRELSALTLGIIGAGTIGKRVSELARAFGMRVLFGATPGRTYAEARLSVQDLFSKSDVVSLHCTLSNDTERFINSESLSWLKKDAVLINVSRAA